jgi:hypothetical protein
MVRDFEALAETLAETLVEILVETLVEILVETLVDLLPQQRRVCLARISGRPMPHPTHGYVTLSPALWSTALIDH